MGFLRFWTLLDCTLLHGAAGWRVSDIASAGMPSLAGLLKRRRPGE